MLNSEWLLRMLRKSGSSPQKRLLALFDILNDWIDAPLIRQAIRREGLGATTEQQLLEFLAQEAEKAGVEQPQEIAHQLHLIALGGLHQELLQPGCGALAHGKQAAQTLVKNQTSTRKPLPRMTSQAWSATAASMFILAIALWPGSDMPSDHALQPEQAAATMKIAFEYAAKPPATLASPDQMAAMYYSIEQMRNGECQYPQALMLPESHRKLYLDNIMGGIIPAQPDHLQDLKTLLQKVDCYYPSQLNSLSVGARHYGPPRSSSNRGV